MGLFNTLTEIASKMQETAERKNNEMRKDVANKANKYIQEDFNSLKEIAKDTSQSSKDRYAAILAYKQKAYEKKLRDKANAYAQSGLSHEELKENIEILEMATMFDDDGMETNYRDVAIRNTPSSNGKYYCFKCQGWYDLKDMDADHILPKSKGGDNSTYNLQLICKHCNRSKQAKTSDTKSDLRRRREEVETARNEDFAVLNIMSKQQKARKDRKDKD